MAERVAHIASTFAGKDTPSDEIICTLQATEAALAEDNNRYKKANKDLNAKANGIRTKELESVPAADPQQPRRRGRPPGQKATVNRRPQKIHRRC